MSTFTVRTSAGDSDGVTDSGTTAIVKAANNILRIDGQPVAHNSGVATPSAGTTVAPGTTPGDVTIDSIPIKYDKVFAMSFKCDLVSIGANTGIPQAYLKLVGALGSTHDFVIPMIPGQIYVWTLPPTKDANGNTFTLESSAAVLAAQALAADFTITCTPDKYSDLSISGTIELLV